MKAEVIEKLALIYVQANLSKGSSATDALKLYQVAIDEIKRDLGRGLAEHVNSSDWSL